jgi:hypothetical protein
LGRDFFAWQFISGALRPEEWLKTGDFALPAGLLGSGCVFNSFVGSFLKIYI